MSYRLADVICRDKASLVDFLPKIKTTCKEDLAVMQCWLNHFKDGDIPFAVTRRGTTYTIWKRRVL